MRANGRPVALYIYQGTDHDVPDDARHVPFDAAEPWHGTTSGYCNRRCRCLDCTEANALSELPRVRKHRAKMRALRAAWHPDCVACRFSCQSACKPVEA